jgi:hypothetical protein
MHRIPSLLASRKLVGDLGEVLGWTDRRRDGGITGVMATGVAYVRMFMEAREVETPLNVCPTQSSKFTAWSNEA